MKTQLVAFLTGIFLLSSCISVKYYGNYNQSNITQVTLNQNNFEVLGSFSGTATVKKSVFFLKDREGVIAKAKQNLLKKAEQEGVNLTGSWALINVTVDLVESKNKITATVSAEIIKFK